MNQYKQELLAFIWAELSLKHPRMLRELSFEKILHEVSSLAFESKEDDDFLSSLNQILRTSFNDPWLLISREDNRDDSFAEIKNLPKDLPLVPVNLTEIWRKKDEEFRAITLPTPANSKSGLLLDLRWESRDCFRTSSIPFIEKLSWHFSYSPLYEIRHYGWSESSGDTFHSFGVPTIQPPQKLEKLGAEWIEAFCSSRNAILFNLTSLYKFFPIIESLRTNSKARLILDESRVATLPAELQDKISNISISFSRRLPKAFLFDYKSIFDNHITEISSLSAELKQPKIDKQPFKVICSSEVSLGQKCYTPLSWQAQSYEMLSKAEQLAGINHLWAVLRAFFYNDSNTDFLELLTQLLKIPAKDLSTEQYFHRILMTLSTLNDDHLGIHHPSISGAKYIPDIRLASVQGRVFVATVNSREYPDISVGDELLHIDNQSLSEIIAKEWPYSFSSQVSRITRLFDWGYCLRRSKGVGITLNLKSPSKNYVTRVYCNLQPTDLTPRAFNKSQCPTSILEIDLTSVSSECWLSQALSSHSQYGAILLDLRGYPCADIRPTLYAFFRRPTDNPPTYLVRGVRASPNALQDSYYDQQFWPHAEVPNITQPTVIMMNGNTFSLAEEIALQLKRLSNVTLIGQQTAGCNGDATFVSLPAGAKCFFTTVKVIDTSGTMFNSRGLRPDIEVQNSQKDLAENTDSIREAAIKFLCELTTSRGVI